MTKPTSAEKALKDIKAKIGSLGNLADAISAVDPKRTITRQGVFKWSVVPLDWVVAVEKATGVPRHKIRPDMPDLFPPPSTKDKT